MPLGEQAQLVKEIEDVRAVAAAAGARITAHEATCELHYKQIAGDTRAMKKSIEAMEGDLQTLVKRGQAAAWSANWKAWTIAAVIGAALLGSLMWTAGQLYSLEPARVHAAEVSKT